MPRSKKQDPSVPQELSEEEIESVVGGTTSGKTGISTAGFQEPLVGTVKKLTHQEDYPIEHGI